MKTIIAEKPSVAREIARVVKATRREAGYLTGNGYNVTWAFGHLVQPALPDGYGIKGFHPDNLPIIPPVFKLIPRQVKSEKGYKPDSDAEAQIKVITRLFRESEKIIVATDAGREGELIFRYLYEYIDCATPFDRLWISSLTDTAIREGLERLESGSKYDNLYYAAKARSEADWLVGINATQAITVAAGRGTYSLGRVQTPTLAMVCERFWENRRFKPEPLWQTHFSTAGGEGGEVVKFSSREKWKEKRPATEAYEALKGEGTARITKVERKETVQEPPLLYDLTTLQKEANAKHGFTAEKTLSIAQKLYEAKLITYPRTGSRYIPEDVFDGIPALLLTLKGNPTWGERLALVGEPTRRSVDAAKVTDHHALLTTGMKPKNLLPDEQTLYDMIVGRMLEAFSEKCVKDVTTVVAECGGTEYAVKGAIVRQAGWRGVYNEETEDTVLPAWSEGTELPVAACSMTEGKTKPKPLHTEATLLAAMETAGKEVEDEEVRQSLKECGIGTPATRAAIIETLFKRNYIRKEKKNLIATPTGVELIQIIHEELLKSAELTGIWEKKLREIERRTYNAGQFLEELKQMVSEVVMSVLSDNSNRHITIQAPAPEKGSKASAKTEAADKPKKEPKKRTPRESAAAGKKTEQASGAVAASSTEASVQADDFVGQPCPLCGKGTVIKGKTAYGCSEWKSGCTFRKPFE